ncbi:unnamed protein product [Mucor hiemalis]
MSSSTSNSSNAITTMNEQLAHNMENAAIEAALACETRAVLEQTRPRNTIYAYIPRQEKFKKWCIERH